MHRREDNVRLLLAHGANPDLKNEHGVSPRDVQKDYFANAAS
jgi:hypothetical protein